MSLTLKIIKSVILIGLVGLVGMYEGLLYRNTKTFNPIEHVRYLRKLEPKKVRTRTPSEERRYNLLYNKMLNLADKDGRAGISFSEQVDAWTRMDYKGPFIESLGAEQFPEPTIPQLEKAIASYEEKNYKENRE